MKHIVSISTLARLITAFLLFYSLKRHPYSYYTVLRWVTFGVGSYSAFIAWKTNKQGWAWILGVIALMFNPLIPVNLKREIWAWIDVASGIVFLLSIYFVQDISQQSEKQEMSKD